MWTGSDPGLWFILPVPHQLSLRPITSKTGFLNLSIIDILYLIILVVKGCPVHCRMFSSIPRVYHASLVSQLVKNPPAMQEPSFDTWAGKIPWRGELLPTPIFWHGEFHVLYSPWGHKELDTTEPLSLTCWGLPGFPGGSDSKESACNAEDTGSIPGSVRSPRERYGYPLQYCCLKNSMDREVYLLDACNFSPVTTIKCL